MPNTGDWYEELPIISSYYESEYEAKFKQHVGIVFPDFFVLTIRETINSPGRKPRKPDLVLIKKDLSEWWLVEVELEGHQLSHVLEQVRVFVAPDINHLIFGRKLKERFDEEYADLSYTLERFQHMVLNAKLGVMVVVDEFLPKWEKPITKLGAYFCIFQVFKSTKAEEAYRISGNYPRTLKKITHCTAFERDPNAYKIAEPHQLGIKAGDTIHVHFNDRVARFDIVEYSDGTVVMKFIGKSNHIPTQKDYVIYIDLDSRFILKTN